MAYRRDRGSGLASRSSQSLERNPMTVTLAPLISLVAGILILVMPKLLNFIVAIYLIAIGLIGLFGMSSLRLH